MVVTLIQYQMVVDLRCHSLHQLAVSLTCAMCQLVIFGGYDVNDYFMNDFWVYDIWFVLPSLLFQVDCCVGSGITLGLLLSHGETA